MRCAFAVVFAVLLCITAVVPGKVQAQSSSLTNLTQWSVDLSVTGYTPSWWFKATGGSGISCTAGSTLPSNGRIGGLSASTSYTFSFYSDATCATAISSLADATVTTPGLAASSITKTTATLTFSAGSTGLTALTYQQYKPTVGTCTPVSGSTTVNLTLTAGTDYGFRAFSVTDCSQSPATNAVASVEFTTNNNPAAPTDLTAVAYHESVTLSWTSSGAVPTITEYEYIKKVGTSPFESNWSDISGSSSTTTSHTITGLTNGTAYEFKVRAVNSEGNGTASSATSSVTPTAATVSAENIEATSAVVRLKSWPGTVLSYQVGSTCTGNSVQGVAPVTLIPIGSLTAQTQYTVAVFKGTGCFSADQVASVTFTTKASTYQAPALSVKDIGNTSATLELSGHAGDWWYGEIGTTGCTKVNAGTSEVDLTLADWNTPYNYRAYSHENCENASSLDWTADVTFNTTGLVDVSFANTQNTVTLTISATSAVTLQGSWSYDYVTTSTGTASSCTDMTFPTKTATASGLTKGTDYTFRVYIAAGCNATQRITRDITTTLLTANQVSGETAELGLSNYGQNWHHGQGGSRNLGKKASASNVSCSEAITGTTAKVTDLEPATTYIWNAYSSPNCTASSQIATVTFVTVSTPQLAVLDVVGTSANISLSNHQGSWWYDAAVDDRKQVSCTPVASGTRRVNVSGLQPGTTYLFSAYSEETCGNHALLGSPVTAVTSATAPPAPSQIEAVPGDTRVTVRWSSGGDGGSAITGWQYVKKIGSGVFETAWTDIPGSGPSTSTTTVIDLTNGTEYQFKVRAVNSLGDGAESSATSAVTPRVNLVPAFSEAGPADQAFTQNMKISAVTLPAASGGNGTVTYRLTPDLPAGLSFDSNTRMLSGTPTEAKPETRYTYSASDEDGDTVELEFAITVAADLFPGFADASIDDLLLTQDLEISPITLPGASGGDGTVDYSLTPDLPAGLTFDSATRMLSGTPSTVQAAMEYTYAATDQDGDAAELTFTITVESDLAPSFAGSSIESQMYVENTAIETVILPEASGGNGSMAYAVTPELPAGLSFDAATRTLSGTPNTTQSAMEYVYTASDQDGDTAELTFTIAVEADQMPTFVDASVANLVFTQGVAIDALTLPAASGGNGGITYSVTPDLPAELSFDATTRTVSGTPTAAQPSSEYNYVATDRDGDTAELTFSITVEADLMPSFAGAAVADQTYKQNTAVEPLTMPEATGGNGAVAYELMPDLPAGLTFDAASRTLSGTPDVALAQTQYTYSATDEDGDAAELIFAITVEADLMPTFAGASIADQSFKQNTAIEAVTLPEATGGDGDVTYALSPDLPTGLSFDAAARTLSGTPDVAQPETQYSYTATDLDGDAVELTFAVTVEADLMPTFTGASIASQTFKQNSAIDAVTLPEAAGGDGSVTYAVTPELPAGLAFDAGTRVISGTPDVAQPETSYTYSATDEDGDVANLTFAVTVEADLMPAFADQSIAGLQLRRGQVMAPVTLPSATGGDGELSYTLTPEPPQGVSFDAASRVLSGVPAAVSAAQAYTLMATDSDLTGADAASVSFTIEVVISTDDREVLSNSLAAQGRALLTSTTSTIGQRFRAPAGQAQGITASALNSITRWVSPMAHSMDPRVQMHSPRLGDLIRGGMLTLSSNNQAGRSAAITPAWTLWSAADAQMYDGATGVQEYGGGLNSLYIGGDVRFAGDWLAGAAVGRSTGNADYTVDTRTGSLETQLTSFYPYISGNITSSLAVWAIGGIGSGEAEDISDHTGALLESSSLDMRMGAVGLNQPLWRTGSMGISLVGAAGFLSLTTEDGEGAINGLDVGVTQARLAVELSRNAGSMAPYVRLGARSDGGDGQTGAGLEVVGGVSYSGMRIAFEAQGRWLAAHSASDYKEYGGMARFQIKARTDGSGLRLNLRPTWGETHSALLGGDGMALGRTSMSSMLPTGGGIAGNAAIAMESDLSYGIPVSSQGMLMLGARQLRYGGMAREAFGFGWESAADHAVLGLNSGLRFRLDYERPTAMAKGGPRMELNYAVRF